MREILGKAKTVRELLKGVKSWRNTSPCTRAAKSQNLLARSLHPQCYDHNPGFLHFKEQSGLPFVMHAEFNKADLEDRSQLYRQIAERIWNPADLLKGGQT